MSTEPIHSGHFMTSNPHTEIQAEDEDEDVEVDVVDVDDSGVTVPAAEQRQTQVQDEKPMTFYKFGPHKAQSIAIDVSLNKLNKCIKVAYMKMTTPKWKDFKGLKLQWKHRIRLNNVIWRAYYMEFRKPDKRKKTPYCYFAVPDDDMTHTKSECSVLEGMYWKRRREGVCAQYKRWRTYNRQVKRRPRGCCRKRCQTESNCQENSCGCEPDLLRVDGGLVLPPQSRTPQHLVSDDFYLDDDFDNVFTDRLFESLDGPFLFPNPKDGMQTGNADIMQPGLLSLQPSIEEIMSIDYGTGRDGLAAFIDRVSREPPGNSDDSPSVISTPQQPQPTLTQASYSVDESPATISTSQLPPNGQPRLAFLMPPVGGQPPAKYLLTPADTNNNSNSRGVSGNPTASQFRGKNITDASTGTPPLLYTAKEYDAVNMLINYSSQKPQDQLFGRYGGSSAAGGSAPLRCEAETRQPLVQVITPQPLYSQAFYSITNDTLPVCVGANNLNQTIGQQKQFQQHQFSPLTPQPQRTASATMPTGFEHLQLQPQQQQQLPLQQQQIQLSVHNNCSSAGASPAAAQTPAASGAAAVLTLDQYVLAAAVAASSASVSSAAGSGPGSGSISTQSSLVALNSLGGTTPATLFNARATQQLLQQPQWWLQSSQPQPQQQPPPQPQLQVVPTQGAIGMTQLSPHDIAPSSYDAFQFLCSAQILPQNHNNTSQQQQQSQQQQSEQQHTRQQQQQQQKSLNKLPLTTTTTTTSVLSILQSAQQQKQQQRFSSTLPQLLNADDMILGGSRAEQQEQSQTSNDLSRYMPTNIGISAPSLTVSTASISLSTMFYASPATNSAGRLMVGAQPAASLTTAGGLYDRTAAVRYSDDATSTSSTSVSHGRDSSSTILQFHHQCQQQQQQANTVAYGGVATASLPPTAVQPLIDFKSAGGGKPSFSIPYPMKKYSQPNPEPSIETVQQVRPSSSDVYCMDDSGGAPHAAKMVRRSNRSESTGMGRRLHRHDAYGTNNGGGGSAPITRAASDASPAVGMARGEWIYDTALSPLSLQSPHSNQQQVLQQQQQLLSPHSSNMSLARQRHASMSSTPMSLTTKPRGERAPTPPASLFASPTRRASVGKRSYANFTVVPDDLSPPTTVIDAKPIDLAADSNGSPLMAGAVEFGSEAYETAAVKEEQEDLSPIGVLLSQREPLMIHGKGHGSKRRGGLNGVAGSSSAPADSTLHPEERKRILHLHAEKNRRSALKDGFDALVDAIPYVEQAGVKSTNAVVLNRAAVHIRALKATAEDRAGQVNTLKQKITQLNERISLIQSNLPTTSRAQTTVGGGSISGGAKGLSSMRSQVEQFFERYTKERCKHDYRFWLMSEIFAPIVRSYAASVHADSTAREAVADSVRRWLDTEWNAGALRPLASDALVRVATASGVFTNDGPDTLPKYILGEITKLS